MGDGIIDSDFRGNVRVIFHNFSQDRVEFNTGGRIVLVLFQKKKITRFVEVKDFNNFVAERNIKRFWLNRNLKKYGRK